MYLLPLACPGWNTFWQKYCCILTKENIDPSHYLWPNYLHYSSVLTYILFLSLPLLIFIFPPQFAFASQYIFPLYPHASLPSPFKPPSSLHVLVGGGYLTPQINPSSLTTSSYIPPNLSIMALLPPPAPLLHDPPPSSLSGGKTKTTIPPTYLRSGSICPSLPPLRSDSSTSLPVSRCLLLFSPSKDGYAPKSVYPLRYVIVSSLFLLSSCSTFSFSISILSLSYLICHYYYYCF